MPASGADSDLIAAEDRFVPMRRHLALATLVALCPTPASAQLAKLGGAVSEADMLYMAGEPRAAFERLQAHLARDPTDYEALWRAARSAVLLGIQEEESRAQNAWLDPAMELAERAVERRPSGLDGVYWRGVAAGRRAMNAAPGYAVELAEVVYGDAHSILEADSLHGGAHNMLGKLNYEIMTVSRIERFIARTFMGNEALDDTSWENAERHLSRAADLWPELVLFHFDLGQLHRERGRRDAAIREFAHTLALPAVHPNDEGLQDRARGFLERWGVAPNALDVSVVQDHATGVGTPGTGIKGSSPALEGPSPDAERPAPDAEGRNPGAEGGNPGAEGGGDTG